MEVFLFVTASVAIVIGLAGLIAGHVPRTMRLRKAPRVHGVLVTRVHTGVVEPAQV